MNGTLENNNIGINMGEERMKHADIFMESFL